MSKAIMCDRCGRFESINDFQEWSKSQKYFLAKGLGSYCVDLCSKCSAELEQWYENGKLVYLNSQKTEPLEAFKVYEKNEKPPKEIEPEEEKPVDSNFGAIDNDLPTEYPMSEPEEKKVVKPATNDNVLSKPYNKKSSTKIKWDDYNVGKMMKMFDDGLSMYEVAAKFRTTVGSISGILSVIRHSQPGHWHHQYRLKYKKFFEQKGRLSGREYKNWTEDDMKLVLEYKKDGKTNREIADLFHVTPNSINAVVSRVRVAERFGDKNDPLYQVAKEYASFLNSTKGKVKGLRWVNEDEIRKLFEAKSSGMTWNEIAKEFNLTRPEIHSFQTGLTGNNKLICAIAKDYGYGE